MPSVEDDCDLHKYDYDKDREINRLAKEKALQKALKDGTAQNWRPDAFFSQDKKECPFFKPQDVIAMMEKPPEDAEGGSDSSSDSSSTSDEKKKKKKKKKEKKKKKKKEKKEKKEKQAKNGWVT
jgi:hypothetical protein